MIKAILLDFYGVLAVRAHQAFLDAYVTDRSERRRLHELRRQRDLGFISAHQYITEAAQSTGLSEAETEYHMHDEWVQNEAFIQLIQQLRPQCKTALVSNAASDVRQFVPGLDLTALCDELIVSAEVGMVKPNPQMFALACERLGVTPDQAIMIDDVKDNCDGARAAGLQTIWYHSYLQCKEELLSTVDF